MVVQRRLFAMGDDGVRAAWRVYVACEDREQLEDTLLRIVRNSDTASDDADTQASTVGVVAQLEAAGLLSADDAEMIVELAGFGHQVLWCSCRAHGSATSLPASCHFLLSHIVSCNALRFRFVSGCARRH